MQSTLIILKPDALRRGLVGEIISRLEKKGLKLLTVKSVKADQATVEEHYAEHKGKNYYQSLIDFLTAGTIIVMAWRGENAISVVRQLVGKTNLAEAVPGTIRGDYCTVTMENLIHASDSFEAAARETAIWFKKD